MFVGRRRPLLRAAMIGGAGYAAGRSREGAANREADQEQRIRELESQQAVPAPAPAPTAAGSSDLVSQLKELSQLQAAGALTQEEFDAAKAKLLAG